MSVDPHQYDDFISTEEARAKLAFKSGKRPLPPASRPGTSSPAQRPNNDLKQPPGANRKMALPQGKGAAKVNGKQGKTNMLTVRVKHG